MFNIFLWLIIFFYDRSVLKLTKIDLAAHKSKFNKESSYSIVQGKFFSSLINPAFGLVFSYRVYSAMYRSDNYLVRKFSVIIYYLSCKYYSCDIHPAAVIGVPFKIGHCSDIVVGPLAVVGKNCYLFNGVSIGNKYVGEKDEMPSIGDNVIVGTGSKILGPINIGSSSTVGALTLVLESIPNDCTVAGVPGRVISLDIKS